MRSGNQTLQLEIHRKSLRNGGFNWEIIEVDGGCATFDDGRVSSLQHKNAISHHWPITEPLRCKGPRPESSVQCNKTTRIGYVLDKKQNSKWVHLKEVQINSNRS